MRHLANCLTEIKCQLVPISEFYTIRGHDEKLVVKDEETPLRVIGLN